MSEGSKTTSDVIVFDESYQKTLFLYLISLGGVQSSIVNTFHIGTGILGVIYYWPYFFLSVYMAKKIPPKGLVGTAFCIVIGAVLSALISTYGKRFV